MLEGKGNDVNVFKGVYLPFGSHFFLLFQGYFCVDIVGSELVQLSIDLLYVSLEGEPLTSDLLHMLLHVVDIVEFVLEVVQFLLYRVEFLLYFCIRSFLIFFNENDVLVKHTFFVVEVIEFTATGAIGFSSSTSGSA